MVKKCFWCKIYTVFAINVAFFYINVREWMRHILVRQCFTEWCMRIIAACILVIVLLYTVRGAIHESLP